MPYKEEVHRLQLRRGTVECSEPSDWRTPDGSILAGPAFPGQPATAGSPGFWNDQRLGWSALNGCSASIPMRQLQLGLKYTF